MFMFQFEKQFQKRYKLAKNWSKLFQTQEGQQFTHYFYVWNTLNQKNQQSPGAVNQKYVGIVITAGVYTWYPSCMHKFRGIKKK